MLQRAQPAKESHTPHTTLHTELPSNSIYNGSSEYFEVFDDDVRPSSPTSKLRRQSSRLLSAFKGLKSDVSPSGTTIVASSTPGSGAESTPRPTPPCSPGPRDTKGKSAASFNKALKKMSSNLFRVPFEPTIVHRNSAKNRPNLGDHDPFGWNVVPPSNSSSNTATTPSTGHSSQSNPGKESTVKTSLDSKNSGLKDSNGGPSATYPDHRATSSHTKRQPLVVAAGHSSAAAELNNSQNLTSIPETALDAASPTVVTVERAAAAKIFLETHFNELLRDPSPRSVRQRQMEAEIYRAGVLESMSETEQERVRAEFYAAETRYLRETRAIKSRSIRALAAPKGSPSTCESDYEVVKILGKGSFGVVRLVREKDKQLANNLQGYKQVGAQLLQNGDSKSRRNKKEVFAMKVIRKSDMLRSCQEGHLRAERDFLWPLRDHSGSCP